MCLSCFSEHWENRDPAEARSRLPEGREEAIARAIELILAHPGVWYLDGKIAGISGPMHAAVEDDNYDIEIEWQDKSNPHPLHQDDQWWAQYDDPNTHAAIKAWNECSEDERSFLVYELFDYEGWQRSIEQNRQNAQQ